jgi:hypothetical protein
MLYCKGLCRQLHEGAGGNPPKKKIRNGNLPNTSPNEVITTLTNLLGKSDYYLRVSVLF